MAGTAALLHGAVHVVGGSDGQEARNGKEVAASRVATQGLQCSSFFVMTDSLLREYDILPRKELHWSPWVARI